MASDECAFIPSVNQFPDSVPSSLLSVSESDSTSHSSTNISVATKNRVISGSHSLCCLCGLNGRYFAHVIPRSDQLTFNNLHASNLLTFPHLHSHANLLYLCPGCHAGYHERLPAWIFLPTNLEPFLAAEQAYHDLRRAWFPIAVARPDPPKATLYTRYQVRLGFTFTRTFRECPIKKWSGSAVAAITRSADALCGVRRLAASECGIPDNVAMKVQRLLWMYGMPDPEVMCVIRVPRVGDQEEDVDNDDNDMLDPKETERSLPPPPSRAVSPTSTKSETTTVPTPRLLDPPAHTKKAETGVTDRVVQETSQVNEDQERASGYTAQRRLPMIFPCGLGMQDGRETA